MPRCPITASSERILPLPQPGKRLDAICWRFAMARSERGNYGSSVRTQERVAGAFAGQADGNAGLAIGAQRIDLRDTRRQPRVAGIDRKREAAVGLGVLMRTAHRGLGWQRGQSLQIGRASCRARVCKYVSV